MHQSLGEGSSAPVDEMTVYPLGIVGESFTNEDGSTRQAEIRRCKPGEAVDFIPDPDNRHDVNCVRVLSVRGIQIGNLPRDCWAIERVQKCAPVEGRIKSIGKGPRGWGVVLDVRTDEDDKWPPLEAGSKPSDELEGPPSAGCASAILLLLSLPFTR